MRRRVRDHCLRVSPGYRSVPLKNSYNEDLELASLLVHMDIISGRVSDFNTTPPPYSI